MELNPIFSDNMIAQAEKPFYVFGTGAGHIRAALGTQCREEVFAGENWLLQFPPMPYGTVACLCVSLDGNEKTVKNITFGDVILLAGQSNMQFKLGDSRTDRAVFPDNDRVRLFSTARMEENEPFFPSDGWLTCRQETASKWSAIGYFVGNLLAEKTGHAVGLVACYQGASGIRSWIPDWIYDENDYDLTVSDLHGDYTHEKYGQWNGKSQLYRFAISQIAPYGVGQVLWYQGESDTFGKNALAYGRMLSDMITGWRKDFRDENLPFTVIQIADFVCPTIDKVGWANVQKAQSEIHLPFVRCVECRDVCENDEIHPATKSRLANKVVNGRKA